MPRSYTAPARRNLLATSADEPFLVLLEITHPELTVPIRVVNDSQNIVVEGNEFIACAFRITLPDDIDQQVPEARLEVDNIGRELTQWLEYSQGGKGAKCRIMQVLRSDPDTVEFDMTLDLSGLSVDNFVVRGQLGFQDTLGQPAVKLRFDPNTAPGLW
jgi:Domain of unknown function (DUF1833).